MPNLLKHQKELLEEIKQFNCDICNIAFSEKPKLNLHIALVHEGKRPFQCQICNGTLMQDFLNKISSTMILNSDFYKVIIILQRQH